MGGDSGVVDVVNDVVSVERLRGGARPDFKDRSVVQLGVTGAMLLFITDLMIRDGARLAMVPCWQLSRLLQRQDGS